MLSPPQPSCPATLALLTQPDDVIVLDAAPRFTALAVGPQPHQILTERLSFHSVLPVVVNLYLHTRLRLLLLYAKPHPSCRKRACCGSKRPCKAQRSLRPQAHSTKQEGVPDCIRLRVSTSASLWPTLCTNTPSQTPGMTNRHVGRS